MNKEEFKKYVIAEASKYLFSTENTPEDTSIYVESTNNSTEQKVSPSEIKKLAEEMKKINKKIDLRNPLISESDESLVESILNENKSSIKDRQVDVDEINKQKHISFQNEGEKEKWNRMLGYNVPSDEDRD